MKLQLFNCASFQNSLSCFGRYTLGCIPWTTAGSFGWDVPVAVCSRVLSMHACVCEGIPQSCKFRAESLITGLGVDKNWRRGMALIMSQHSWGKNIESISPAQRLPACNVSGADLCNDWKRVSSRVRTMQKLRRTSGSAFQVRYFYFPSICLLINYKIQRNESPSAPFRLRWHFSIRALFLPENITSH